jgi:hypothetical protein
MQESTPHQVFGGNCDLSSTQIQVSDGSAADALGAARQASARSSVDDKRPQPKPGPVWPDEARWREGSSSTSATQQS